MIRIPRSPLVHSPLALSRFLVLAALLFLGALSVKADTTIAGFDFQNVTTMGQTWAPASTLAPSIQSAQFNWTNLAGVFPDYSDQGVQQWSSKLFVARGMGTDGSPQSKFYIDINSSAPWAMTGISMQTSQNQTSGPSAYNVEVWGGAPGSLSFLCNIGTLQATSVGSINTLNLSLPAGLSRIELRVNVPTGTAYLALDDINIVGHVLPTTWVVTSVADSGAGTLRAAIAAAKDGDTIEFVSGLFTGAAVVTIPLTSGALVVSKNLTIVGPGDISGTATPHVQLVGNGSDRLLQVQAPANVTVAGIGFQGGKYLGLTLNAVVGGGAVLIDAGASATFQGCDFTGNTAAGFHNGGAILNRGTLTLDQCLVAHNSAQCGGGIYSEGRLQVTRSLIERNTVDVTYTGIGGGIYVVGADFSIESSTISGNTARAGGGIAFLSTTKIFESGNAAGTGSGPWIIPEFTLSADTFVSEISNYHFGYNGPAGTVGLLRISPSPQTQIGTWTATAGWYWAVYPNVVLPAGTYRIIDSSPSTWSYSASTAYHVFDGLRSSWYYDGPNWAPGKGMSSIIGMKAATVTATLTAVTVLDNSATASAGGLYVDGKYAVANVGGSIFSRNTSLDFATQNSGTINSTGYNIVAAPGTALTATGTGDQIGVDPQTMVLDYYGGRTKTYSLSAGSSAINNGNPAFSGSLVTTDQRGLGFSRVAGGRVDVGAIESAATAAVPVFNSVPADITAEAAGAGGAVVTYGAPLATGADSVMCVPASGSLFPVGINIVTVTATNAAGTSTRTFSVTVRDTTKPVITSVHYNQRVAATSVDGAVVSFNTPIATDAMGVVSLTYKVNQGAPIAITGTATTITTTFPMGENTVMLTATDRAGNAAKVMFKVLVASNVVWTHALDLDLKPILVASPSGLRTGVVQQKLMQLGESRWYKFKGLPGSRINVALTNVPANFNLVVYSDVKKAYDSLSGLITSSILADQKLALLGAGFAPEAYSPEAYSPEAYSPEAYSPEAYSPEAYSPEAYSPEAYSPEAYSPEAYSPEAYSPEAYSPEAYSPEAYSPEAYSPEAYSPEAYSAATYAGVYFSPEAYSPEAYSPEAYSPEAYSPEAYSPEAYSGAQQRSVLGFSANGGTQGEGIRFGTYSRSGEFYIRVRGQNGVYSTQAPFTLTVTINQSSGVTDTNTTPASTPTVSGSPTSLIVWNSARIEGLPADIAALATSLANFAAAANGVVVDVNGDTRIQALNAQADRNPDSPIAKNLVAETIRNLIRLYRTAKPSIADITLVGNDDVIPFFRMDDKAMLASEANYFPPVKDFTQSQSSLRYAQVLTQDRYGSSNQVFLGTGPYDLPDLPVGRLVETATEVKVYVDAYIGLFNSTATSGSVPTPRSAFVAGYDFLADAAAAMQADLATGLGAGARVDALMSPITQAPAFGWTADQLRAAFLGSRHDVSFLAGHFSTSRALAADFTTRLLAKEVTDSTVDFKYALVMSAGCHSGYSTVDKDAVPLLTDQPDWAQAFARKNAIWIAGTGYQYGDTDFVEYTERLLLNVAQALRAGSGPVAIGRALVEAKRRYLADTAVMRGIHEKTLLEVVLYGLPMVKFNLPGGRFTKPAPAGGGASAAGVAVGTPGAVHALKTADLSFSPALTRVDKTLNVVGSTSTQTASYFRGSAGVVTIPGEPVRPLQSFNVTRPTVGLVRGIGFRGGVYNDLPGFVPFTGAPATETRGVHGGFSTEVFYPVRPWSLNQIGELCDASGLSVLNAFPTQFLSDAPDATTGVVPATGTLRKYSQMNFTVFYCPEASAAALANPPAINVVRSSQPAANGPITFSVDVAATSSAGVQEVWVTYTTGPSSTNAGEWRSLTLTAPNATGVGTWTGTLTLAGEIRYMVQAVNGFGTVSQNTNFGRYFKAGTSTLDGVAAVGTPPPALTTTKLALVAPGPTVVGGEYRASIPVQARLTDASDMPLAAGKRVHFRLGTVTKSAVTNASGIAAANLVLNAPPDSYALEATFGGDSTYRNSSAAQAFTVLKKPTSLTFASGAVVVDAAHLVVKLRASDGTPLTQRTVVFKVVGGSTTKVLAEITDGAGQANLTSAALTPGTYQVTAYFGQTVTLPNSSSVPLNDPLYGGSATATTAITVASSLRLGEVEASIVYNDASAVGAAANNRGASKIEVQGEISSSTRNFGPSAVLASARASVVTASVVARVSGKTIAVGAVPLRVLANDNKHWQGDAVLNGASVRLQVDWEGSDDSSERSSRDGDAQRRSESEGASAAGKYHVWITPAPGSRPLYNAAPALLSFQVILGTGAGEHPLGGEIEIGGPAKPWTKQTPALRMRSP